MKLASRGEKLNLSSGVRAIVDGRKNPSVPNLNSRSCHWKLSAISFERKVRSGLPFVRPGAALRALKRSVIACSAALYSSDGKGSDPSACQAFTHPSTSASVVAGS
jgi:hypothetical protein